MEDGKIVKMPTIGEVAPSFCAASTRGDINFPGDYMGKWVILFSYQMDFTPVCTTELMILASMEEEFKELEVELLGLSIASVYSHIAWLRKMKELAWKDIKHVDITFPIIADVGMEVADQYAMLHRETSTTQTVRAVFLIDSEGIIRAIMYYPLSVGRNIQELKRLVLALQKADKEKAATPADWMPGDDFILPPPKTCDAAAQRMEHVGENTYCLDWFLAFCQNNCMNEEIEKEPEINPYPSVFPMKKKKITKK